MRGRPSSTLDRDSAMRWALAAGGLASLAIPIVMWACLITFGLRRANYDLLTQPASQLAERGSANAVPFSIGYFYLPGALAIACAGGIRRATQGSGAGLLAAALVVVGSVSLVLSGLFPMDPASPAATDVHRLVGTPLILAMPGAPLLLAAGIKDQPGWRAARAVSIVVGVALAVLLALELAPPMTSHVPVGLFQRALLVVQTPWFIVVGASLTAASRWSAGPSAASPLTLSAPGPPGPGPTPLA